MEILSVVEKAIYDQLMDEQSREIFLARKYHAQQGNSLYDKFIYESPFVRKLNSTISKYRFIIYGFGGEGKQFYDYYVKYFNNGNLVAIWDGSPTKYNGALVDSYCITKPSVISSTEFDYVIITPAAYEKYSDMYETCVSMGISKSKIMCLKKFPDQYLDDDLIPLDGQQIFVDGGSFDLSDSLDFIRKYKNRVNKIYAFEPDGGMYNKIRDYLDKNEIENISIYNYALWCEDTYLNFDSDMGRACSSISQNSKTAVKAIALDNFLPNKDDITFIKFDIEGAELQALKGARTIIARCIPTLAICIYHKPEDYYIIPQYILSIFPKYKLYMRHYHYTAHETVLYCIP